MNHHLNFCSKQNIFISSKCRSPTQALSFDMTFLKSVNIFELVWVKRKHFPLRSNPFHISLSWICLKKYIYFDLYMLYQMFKLNAFLLNKIGLDNLRSFSYKSEYVIRSLHIVQSVVNARTEKDVKLRSLKSLTWNY